jgi:hypothetical protein
MAIYSDSGFITARDTPLIRPTLDLNFAREKRLDSRVLFTRGSSGTYTDENGIIRTAANNVPRFDHDPATGESLGLLIEESRTNIVTGVGGATNAILTSGQNNELTGNEDAYLYQKNVSSSAESPIAIPVSGSVSTASFTYSAFVKPGTSNKIYFQTVANNLSDNAYHYFSIGDNTSVSVDYASSGNLTYTRTITPLHSGWYRLSVTIFGFSDTSLYLSQVRIGSFSGTTTHNYTNTTDTFYFYGPQVEIGSFPTSYIPTSGSTVTRAADLASISGTNFAEWYNPTESTICFESLVSPLNNSKYFTFHGSGAGGTQLIESAATSGPGANIFTYSNSTVHSSISVNDASFTRIKYATGVKQNNVNIAINGILGTLDTSAAQPDAIDNITIGNYTSGNYYINTSISRLTYYPKRFSDAQLQALTS